MTQAKKEGATKAPKKLVITDVLEGSSLKEQPIIKDIPSFQKDMKDPDIQMLLAQMSRNDFNNPTDDRGTLVNSLVSGKFPVPSEELNTASIMNEVLPMAYASLKQWMAGQ